MDSLSVSLSVHANGQPLNSRVVDFDWFSTLKVVIPGAPTEASSEVVFFLEVHQTDEQLANIVEGILRSRPRLLQDYRDRLPLVDGGYENAIANSGCEFHRPAGCEYGCF